MNPDVGPDVFPRISTAHYLLRPLTVMDVDAIFAIFSDPVVTRYWGQSAFEVRAQAPLSSIPLTASCSSRCWNGVLPSHRPGQLLAPVPESMKKWGHVYTSVGIVF